MLTVSGKTYLKKLAVIVITSKAKRKTSITSSNFLSKHLCRVRGPNRKTLEKPDCGMGDGFVPSDHQQDQTDNKKQNTHMY